jgi:predicted secreted hydrolase
MAIAGAMAQVVTPAADYREALPGYRFAFPRDHFEHRDFRTEWWYYTGNLRGRDGKRFGFELVFFRQGRGAEAAVKRSSWRVEDLYLAHLALTDIDGKRFFAHQRLNRAGPGIAGASFEQRRVWNGNWSARWSGDRQTIEATAEEFRLRIALDPLKPPVIHGVNGVSQKAEGAGRASHYVSFTRLKASGAIELDGARIEVDGAAWMDHEWFTHQLAESQVGWDWFSAQLDSGRELMVFQLRTREGGVDPHSSGTYVDERGTARRLSSSEFSLEPLRHWVSAKTGARYPVEWRVRAPSLGLDLKCEAALDAQELVSQDGSGPNYWEGAVRYSGSAAGVGYLEMTGYDKPVKLE